jgi:hypothetical protein
LLPCSSNADGAQAPTTVVQNNVTYTVSSATTLTITACPCTQTKTYPATVSTTVVSYLTTVRPSVSDSVTAANSFPVLPTAHYHHLLCHYLPSYFSRYRDHPDRTVYDGYHLPSHNWHCCSSSNLGFLPRGNWQSHHHQRDQHTKVTFSNHERPRSGLC